MFPERTSSYPSIVVLTFSLDQLWKRHYQSVYIECHDCKIHVLKYIYMHYIDMHFYRFIKYYNASNIPNMIRNLLILQVSCKQKLEMNNESITQAFPWDQTNIWKGLLEPKWTWLLAGQTLGNENEQYDKCPVYVVHEPRV